MRIAGNVSKSERLEVDYIKSVHLVSRWIHEMFDTDGSAHDAGPGNNGPGASVVASRRGPA